jgi:hypothetical protein
MQCDATVKNEDTSKTFFFYINKWDVPVHHRVTTASRKPFYSVLVSILNLTEGLFWQYSWCAVWLIWIYRLANFMANSVTLATHSRKREIVRKVVRMSFITRKIYSRKRGASNRTPKVKVLQKKNKRELFSPIYKFDSRTSRIKAQ